jgi:hypothetical protein
MMNDKIAEAAVNPKVCAAKAGNIDRSKPTMPPTNAFTTTNKVNCFQFALSPKVGVSFAILTTNIVFCHG